MFKDTTVFVGIDIGDRRSELCLLDRDGQVIKESHFRTTTPAPQLSLLTPRSSG